MTQQWFVYRIDNTDDARRASHSVLVGSATSRQAAHKVAADNLKGKK